MLNEPHVMFVNNIFVGRRITDSVSKTLQREMFPFWCSLLEFLFVQHSEVPAMPAATDCHVSWIPNSLYSSSTCMLCDLCVSSCWEVPH